MIEYFTNLPAIKFEPRVREMDHGDACDENDEPRVLIALRVEWILTDFITVWLVVKCGLLVECVAAGIPIENMSVTAHRRRLQKQ